MSAIAEIFTDGLNRVRDGVHEAVADLTVEELHVRIDADANSVTWLIWHIARVQDAILAAAAGEQQIWFSSGWDERFGMPGYEGIGRGHTSEEVARVRVDSVDQLLEYYDEVFEMGNKYLSQITEVDLEAPSNRFPSTDRTVSGWLVTALAGPLQHVGQAAYVRGILMRARR